MKKMISETWASPERLSDLVRHLLLEQLTSGALAPGDRINEAELARQLGISRNPIREAISALAQSGLILAIPRRGAFLRNFTLQDVHDVFSFRVSIECFAARQALARLSGAAGYGELKAIVQQMEDVAKLGDRVQVQQIDLRFHRLICELSGNRQTVQAYDMLSTELQMLIAAVDIASGSLLESARSHLPIAAAFERGDVDEAVRAIEAHVEHPWSLAEAHYKRLQNERDCVGRRVGVAGARRRHNLTIQKSQKEQDDA